MKAHERGMQSLGALAYTPDEGQAWRKVRSAIALDAMADEEWTSRFSARPEIDDHLEQVLEGFPITIPRDLGTEHSRRWADRLRRDGSRQESATGQQTTPTSVASPRAASGETLSLAADTARLLLRRPLVVGALVATAAALPQAYQWGSQGGVTAKDAMLIVAYAAAGGCAFLLARKATRAWRPLNQLAALCFVSALLLAPASLVSALLLLMGCGACSWTCRNMDTDKPSRDAGACPASDDFQDSCPLPYDLDELDDGVVRLLRARARLYDVHCSAVDALDSAAVVIGYDLWMFSLKAQSIDQAPWFGPASMESIAALVARASGQGRRGPAMPGMAADPEDFPGVSRRLLLWRAWAESKVGPDSAEAVLQRVAWDLEGSYSDRVARVSRLLTQPG